MLVTELIAALSDAKMGELNETVIVGCNGRAAGKPQSPSDDLDTLAALKAYGLYELYPIPATSPSLSLSLLPKNLL